MLCSVVYCREAEHLVQVREMVFCTALDYVWFRMAYVFIINCPSANNSCIIFFVRAVMVDRYPRFCFVVI